MMNNETFYDSLEESYSNNSSSTSVIILIKPNFSPRKNYAFVPEMSSFEDVGLNIKEVISSPKGSFFESDAVQTFLGDQTQKSAIESEYDTNIKSISQYDIRYKNSINNNSKNCKNNIPNRRSNLSKKHDHSSLCKWEEVKDISCSVPLYGGDVNRDELKISKKHSSTPALNRKKMLVGNNTSMVLKDSNTNSGNSKCNQKGKCTRRTYSNTETCVNIDALPKSNPTKSYLNLFHTRIGYPTESTNSKQLPDTTRSIFGDSARSFVTDVSGEEFVDAEAGNDSDSTSFYLQHIENETKNKAKQKSTETQSLNGSCSPTKLCSISEVYISIDTSIKRKKKKSPRKQNLKSELAVHRLSNDTESLEEKLARRRKQLSYGQKASNRNRIKMIETQVLRNLNMELHKSSCVNNEMKKF